VALLEGVIKIAVGVDVELVDEADKGEIYGDELDTRERQCGLPGTNHDAKVTLIGLDDVNSDLQRAGGFELLVERLNDQEARSFEVLVLEGADCDSANPTEEH
jgi:hypothetical protein